jgi:hypothetical protein
MARRPVAGLSAKGAGDTMRDRPCDDCAGFDYEWMKSCVKHGTEFCRGCSCPICEEEDYNDGDYELEDAGNPSA